MSNKHSAYTTDAFQDQLINEIGLTEYNQLCHSLRVLVQGIEDISCSEGVVQVTYYPSVITENKVKSELELHFGQDRRKHFNNGTRLTIYCTSQFESVVKSLNKRESTRLRDMLYGIDSVTYGDVNTKNGVIEIRYPYFFDNAHKADEVSRCVDKVKK